MEISWNFVSPKKWEPWTHYIYEIANNDQYLKQVSSCEIWYISFCYVAKIISVNSLESFSDT